MRRLWYRQRQRPSASSAGARAGGRAPPSDNVCRRERQPVPLPRAVVPGQIATCEWRRGERTYRERGRFELRSAEREVSERVGARVVRESMAFWHQGTCVPGHISARAKNAH